MDLRLIVVTEAALIPRGDLEAVVRSCLEAGAPAIQLRDKTATSRELFEQAKRLRILCSHHGATLFINDRLDVALAAGAGGVHLGPTDLPLPAARRAGPPPFLIGYSADDPEIAHSAIASGADYIGCGSVFGTDTKVEVAGERIGVERLREVVRAAGGPVVAIGGITAENAALAVGAGAAGVAVVSALMRARDPGAVVRRILEAFPAPGG